MRYKLCEFCENRTRDSPLSGVYIPHSVKSEYKFQFWGSYTLVVAPMWVKFSVDGPLLHANFHSHRCNVSLLRSDKPQNRRLIKLNTGRLALRAMLPVISVITWYMFLLCYVAFKGIWILASIQQGVRDAVPIRIKEVSVRSTKGVSGINNLA